MNEEKWPKLHHAPLILTHCDTNLVYLNSEISSLITEAINLGRKGCPGKNFDRG